MTMSEWQRSSGSGVMKPVDKVSYASRRGGKTWLVKVADRIVREIRCDQDPHARANAHTHAQNLRRRLSAGEGTRAPTGAPALRLSLS